jgi:SAM-dependent methyltransferase
VSGSENLYRKRQLEAIAARWDLRAAGWDAALEDPACHLNEDDAYQGFLKEAQAIIDVQRAFCRANGVIDAGCGTGLVLGQVIPFFAWGMGVDISSEMIRAARRKCIPNARFSVGDCFSLAQLCPAAGAIFSRGVLLSHYGRDQGLVLLSAIRAALVPDGFFMCDFLNVSVEPQSGHIARGKTHFSTEEVLRMGREAGFRRTKVLGPADCRALILLSHV